MFRLPTLVFAENHEDPATFATLNRLMPKLIEMGYGEFCDELPAHMNKEEAIKFFEAQEIQYEKLLHALEKWNREYADEADQYIQNTARILGSPLRFSTKIDISAFNNPNLTEEQKTDLLVMASIIWLAENSILPTFAVVQGQLNLLLMGSPLLHTLAPSIISIRDSIFRHESRVEYLQFVKNNLSAHINYRSMDESLGMVWSMSGFNEAIRHPSRDDKMANTLLFNSRPTLSRMGLLHATGIQERIIRQLNNNLEMSQARFCFFYLYSQPEMVVSSALSKLNKDYEEMLEIIKNARQGGVGLPLKLTPIDIRGKSDDELLGLIVNEIEKSQKMFAEYAATARLNMADELSEYAIVRENEKKVQHSEYHSIFGRTTHNAAAVKVSAAEKASKLLSGNAKEVEKIHFEDEEVAAMQEGRLSKFIKKLAFLKLWPVDLLKTNEADRNYSIELLSQHVLHDKKNFLQRYPHLSAWLIGTGILVGALVVAALLIFIPGVGIAAPIAAGASLLASKMALSGLIAGIATEALAMMSVSAAVVVGALLWSIGVGLKKLRTDTCHPTDVASAFIAKAPVNFNTSSIQSSLPKRSDEAVLPQNALTSGAPSEIIAVEDEDNSPVVTELDQSFSPRGMSARGS